MRNMAVAVASLMTLGVAYGDKRTDTITRSLEQLRTDTKCSDKGSPHRAWCIATGFVKGTAPALPKKPLIGIGILFGGQRDVATALEDTRFMTVAFDPVANKLAIHEPNPSNAAEEKEYATNLAQLRAVLDGKAKTVKLSKTMATFVREWKGTDPLEKVGTTWIYSDDDSTRQLRRVGDRWVLVELLEPDVFTVVIFTDRWQ